MASLLLLRKSGDVTRRGAGWGPKIQK